MADASVYSNALSHFAYTTRMKRAQTHTLFPAIVREYQFGDLPVNQEFYNRIKTFQRDIAIKNAGEKPNVATILGYQPDIVLHEHWDNDPTWEQFLNTCVHPGIQSYLTEHARLAGWPTTDYGYNFAASWAVLYPAGAYQIPHNHPNTFCVMAYYANVPIRPKPEGAISFINPHVESTFPREFAWEYHRNFYPRNGTAVVFPGWLQHYSHPHKSSEERLLLTFDVQLLPPE